MRLIDIVNDFLDTSRLEQGKIAFEYTKCSIEEIIENIIYEMKNAIKERKIKLTFDQMAFGKLPKVWADKNRVKQIAYNLIGNAIEYTENGEVAITSQGYNGMLRVTVTDTGRGIAVETQKFLFHKFQQAGESLLTRDTTRGTGLGLYISKLLAKNMGGDVVLEYSKEGEGSSFSFSLPVATPEHKRRTEQKRHAKIDPSTGLTV